MKAEKYLKKNYCLKPSEIRKFRGDRLAEIMNKYAKKLLIDFGIWLDKNERFIENGNITKNVNDFLNSN